MEQIYYGVAIVFYGIFIVRFILSWIGGDFEIDADLDISDVVSFKGVTHFMMGLSGWLSIKSFTTHNVQWYDFIIATITTNNGIGTIELPAVSTSEFHIGDTVVLCDYNGSYYLIK